VIYIHLNLTENNFLVKRGILDLETKRGDIKGSQLCNKRKAGKLNCHTYVAYSITNNYGLHIFRSRIQVHVTKIERDL